MQKIVSQTIAKIRFLLEILYYRTLLTIFFLRIVQENIKTKPIECKACVHYSRENWLKYVSTSKKKFFMSIVSTSICDQKNLTSQVHFRRYKKKNRKCCRFGEKRKNRHQMINDSEDNTCKYNSWIQMKMLQKSQHIQIATIWNSLHNSKSILHRVKHNNQRARRLDANCSFGSSEMFVGIKYVKKMKTEGKGKIEVNSLSVHCSMLSVDKTFTPIYGLSCTAFVQNNSTRQCNGYSVS